VDNHSWATLAKLWWFVTNLPEMFTAHIVMVADDNIQKREFLTNVVQLLEPIIF
jgi:hypothetical protein